MLDNIGDSGEPCGHPFSVFSNLPSTITPAFNALAISVNSRSSAIFCGEVWEWVHGNFIKRSSSDLWMHTIRTLPDLSWTCRIAICWLLPLRKSKTGFREAGIEYPPNTRFTLWLAIRSITTGIPNFLILEVPSFGISTLRAGLKRYLPLFSFSWMIPKSSVSRLANSSTVILSIPATQRFSLPAATLRAVVQVHRLSPSLPLVSSAPLWLPSAVFDYRDVLWPRGPRPIASW